MSIDYAVADHIARITERYGAQARAMVAALERLQQASSPAPLPEGMQAFGISGGAARFGALFMTHPPLPVRIAALKSAAL